MTVEELRKEKSTLDFKILTLIRDFHEKTGLVVNWVNVEKETTELHSMLDKIEITNVTTQLSFE